MSEQSSSLPSSPTAPQTGRNEPCPCGSGKKFKRCHGVGAAPKLTTPKNPVSSGFNPQAAGLPPEAAEMVKNMDPNFMKNMMGMMSRIPRPQLMKLQAMMQRAMAGEDVSAEAAVLEKGLPPEFKEFMGQAAMSSQFAQMMAQNQSQAAAGTSGPDAMSLEEAKRIVEAAAEAGKISESKAKEVLAGVPEQLESEKKGFFKGLFGKK